MTDKAIDVSELKENGYFKTNALEEVDRSEYEVGPYSMGTFIKKLN